MFNNITIKAKLNTVKVPNDIEQVIANDAFYNDLYKVFIYNKNCCNFICLKARQT